MKATEIVRDVMEREGVKQTTLAARLNIKKTTMNERLKFNNISIDKLNDMLRALDYKVLIVPRNSRVPDGGYEVE